MKRILLTTTSLVLAAGVAQAEVTFSGKMEAGVSRTEKTAATAAVAGVQTSFQSTAADDGSNVALANATAATTTVGSWGYNSSGVLTSLKQLVHHQLLQQRTQQLAEAL